MSTSAARQLLALLDDAAQATPLIELSSALAQSLHRPLEVVYVESTAALLAAALPFTRVLAPGGAQWQSWQPHDVERGYRAEAARLRALVEQLARRQAIEGTLRVVRGALLQAALELQPQSDLMLLAARAGTATLAPPTRRSHRRAARRVVVVLGDETEAGRTARRVAEAAARALGGVLSEAADGDEAALAAGALHCELLVLPRSRLAPRLLARLAQPTLLVG
jgi:hypothetical protein